MSESVKVAVRCRPISNKELQQRCQVCVRCIGEERARFSESNQCTVARILIHFIVQDTCACSTYDLLQHSPSFSSFRLSLGFNKREKYSLSYRACCSLATTSKHARSYELSGCCAFNCIHLSQDFYNKTSLQRCFMPFCSTCVILFIYDTSHRQYYRSMEIDHSFHFV